MDLRKPGEDEEEDYEIEDDGMEPDECFPDCKKKMHCGKTILLFSLQWY